MPRLQHILLSLCLTWVLVPVTGREATPPRAQSTPRIDRQALVSRHSPVLRRFDPESPLSVGNGEFAFTADVTGLQTFADAYDTTIPLGTLSQWGWHTAPNPGGWSMETFRFEEFESHGRPVGYAGVPGNRMTPEIEWLRSNPHRLHLGQIRFRLTHRDGRPAVPSDLSNIEQTLDLWNGILVSRFDFDGEPAHVETLCRPDRDELAVRVRSPLTASRRLAIEIRFPYGTGGSTAADWTKPAAHHTTVTRRGTREAIFERQLDRDRYEMHGRWSAGALNERAAHTFEIDPAAADTFEFSAAFSPIPPPASAGAGARSKERTEPDAGVSFEAARRVTSGYWNRFWEDGGAIDLSASADPRWRELERRIVLSQYLTAIQSAGTYPPQETGLTFNSWEGKFHLEMHWWHAAQFALWNRLPLLEKSLGYYGRIRERARATARRQGYRGARWPKMTGPNGAESPSSVGPFLIWQQPHPIFYAELVYRQRRDRDTLERFREVIFDTADFMASFAARDGNSSHFVLGPPLQCAQEVFPKATTVNCTFELAYWRWGLETAQSWRTRLGLPREPSWDAVLAGLAPLPVSDGKYLFAASAPDSYSNPRWRRDHPAVTGALGMLPGNGVDRETMGRTFDWIWENWNWTDTWGWDYPLLAMTAARLGEPERAIDALLLDTPKNVFRTNGHNHQRPGLTIYLPGNGALLYAVAMMAAGWDGAPDRPAPGFPAGGRWVVRWENLHRAP